LQGNLSRSLFAKFLIVVIFILISIQAFQIVSVRSAFAQCSIREQYFGGCPQENHPPLPELKDETIAHPPPPPELKDETHLQMPH